MQLILYTSSYPYDFSAEYTFIQPEIGFLSDRFDRIILAPRTSKGRVQPLPSNVEVDDSYSDSLHRDLTPGRMVRMAFSSSSVRNELRKRPDIWPYPSKILKLLLFDARVEVTKKWTTDLIQSRQIDPKQCLLYSYWMDHSAAGLARAKLDFPALKVISRAHGFDIFEEYYYPHYWPYREETLRLLDRVFFASESGRQYLCSRYPEFVSKFETAHLGINDPGFICSPSRDGIFRIVSCSYIVPVKRLNRLVDGIAAAARRRPGQKFEWMHIGDGKGIRSLARRIAHRFPSNVAARLMGHLPNDQVLQFYRDHAVDVFVNVSETEGGAPVSIQEAISCGIPVVATSIGGNPEIVSEQNGTLLSPDPSPDEIAAAFFHLIDHPHSAVEKRTASRRVWQERYNAAINSRAFAERLKSIRESS